MINKEDRCSEITIDEFAEKIKLNLEDYFGDTKKVTINKVMKNNGVNFTGITLMSDNSNVAPTVYIDSCYQRYIKGELYAQIMNELISTLESHIVNKSMDMDFFSEYEKVKNNIAMKLINKTRNSMLLKEVPNIDFLDMSIVFYYAFDDGFDDTNTLCQYTVGATILINNSLFKRWNITIDELYDNAYKNTREKMGVNIQNLNDLMRDILYRKMENIDDEFEKASFKEHIKNILFDFDNSNEIRRMLVLTSNDKQYGAVNIIYNDILEKIAIDCSSDLIILPSSIHEVIIIVNDNKIRANELKSMVKEVNINEVPLEDILSDSVYIYERETSKIRLLA